VQITPLDDLHDRVAFECGVEPLDRYFRTQTGQEGRKRLASCFVLTAGSPAVIAFYTLTATSIALHDLPASMTKKLPHYPFVPVTLMGRLAVDHRYSGQRLGELMIMDAFSRTLRSEIATYAFVVDAKDERAESFYKAHDFSQLGRVQCRLFKPMAEIAKLFA